jgi:acyl carrier protein
MTKDEIFERIATVLEDTFDIERERIKPEARLYDDLDVDSIDAVDLIVKLKPMLTKPLQPEHFKSVRTVQDVVDAFSLLIDAPAVTPSAAPSAQSPA